jgi:5-methylcytosine-specific restriction protein A
MSDRNGSTRTWRELRARVLKASDVCRICGQPGADSVDHMTPLARGGTNPPSNLAPAHHLVEPRCDLRKGDRDFAPIVRRSGVLK